MNMEILNSVILETGDKPQFAVIWLHGLGADGHDFEPIVPDLKLPSTRFVFPHAPNIPVSINDGYIMPAWYDIRETDLGIGHDEAGVLRSEKQIQLLIEQQQMHGIPANRIMLAGFSQGGAMALYCGLRQTEPLAGIVALSCYFLLPENMPDTSSAVEHTPIFMAHGTEDPVVSFELGKMAQHRLVDMGYQLTWKHYSMQHQVCADEINAIGAWIKLHLGVENA